jgi:hypothetical protein
MKPERKSIWLGIGAAALGIGLLIGIVGAAAAQAGILQGDWRPSEPGAAAEAHSGPAPAGRLDIDPNGPQPDENPPAGARPQAPNLSFSYLRGVGAAFKPRTSASTYSYDITGCIHGTGGGDSYYVEELHLPQGATIKYLRGYAMDTTNSNAVLLYLTRYDPGLSTTDILSINSDVAFAGGYETFLSQEITETVDNLNYSYIALAYLSNDPATLLCGIRVAYYAPVTFALFAPIVRR